MKFNVDTNDVIDDIQEYKEVQEAMKRQRWARVHKVDHEKGQSETCDAVGQHR